MSHPLSCIEVILSFLGVTHVRMSNCGRVEFGMGDPIEERGKGKELKLNQKKANFTEPTQKCTNRVK